MKRQPFDRIELLESRIAPASTSLLIIDPHTATYNDLDGDLVTVKVTHGTLTAGLFTTSAISTSFGSADQLQELNLSGGDFDHANLTITAKPQMIGGKLRGDGVVNVGAIDSTNHDLGVVKIGGDLGQIDAGDANLSTPGVQSLKVLSMGRFGTSTGAPSLQSTIAGPLGMLQVSGDTASGVSLQVGSLGPVNVGGSYDGSLISNAGIGFLKVGGDFGGGLQASGDIAGAKVGGYVFGFSSGGKIGMVTIGGSLQGGLHGRELAGVNVGGNADGSQIEALLHVGPVKIGGECRASIVCQNGNIDSVTVGGNLGDYIIAGNKIGPVFVAGNFDFGQIQSGGDMASIKIVGSMVGGTGFDQNASIDCGGTLKSLQVGGSIEGGSGKYNLRTDTNGVLHDGQVYSLGPILNVSVTGGLQGGSGISSGEIHSHSSIVNVKIGGDVRGDNGINSGQITSDGTIGQIAIGGNLYGGFVNETGSILSVGNIGNVKIGGSVFGAGNLGGSYFPPVNFTGRIASGGNIGSVTLGGSLVGGFEGNDSGEVMATGKIGSIKIAGNVVGGFVTSNSIDSTGYIQGNRIGSVFIGGSISAGFDNSNSGTLTKSGSIRAVNDIGSITVGGSVLGSDGFGDRVPVVISARGQVNANGSTDLAIGKITIGGKAEAMNILAGYDPNLNGVNADAQIGTVIVEGDWIGSNLIAGVQANNGQFGDFGDSKMSGPGVKDNSDLSGAISKIASVVIKGNAIGTLAPDDSATFGIEAQQLGSIQLGGAFVPLIPGASNDLFFNGHPLSVTTGTGNTSDGFDFHAFEV